jgi:urea transport system permease protein
MFFRGWFGAAAELRLLFHCGACGPHLTAASLVGLILSAASFAFYKRPLESLLATWGVSLVLQQVFRHIFGAASVFQVGSPSWLSGSFVVKDVLLAYNRIFIIGFAMFVVMLTYWLLTHLARAAIRAVMQNRSMASARHAHEQK